MAKIVEVTDAAGVLRRVRPVDAREIEALVTALNPPKVVEVPVVEEEQSDKFPKDFPGSAVLEREGIGYHASLRLTRDELIAVNGIGEKTADEILKLRK